MYGQVGSSSRKTKVMTVTIEINDKLKGVIMLEMLTSLLGALLL